MSEKTSLDIKKETLFWMLIVGLVGLVFAKLGDVLSPFVTATVLAFFFTPIVDELEKRKVPRSAASFFVMVLIILSIIGTWAVFIPLVTEQLWGLIEKTPDYWLKIKYWLVPDGSGENLKDKAENFMTAVPAFNTTENVQDFLQKHIGSMWSGVSGILGNVWAGGKAVFDVLSFIIIMPVVAFYMMRDWPEFLRKADDMLPRKHYKPIKMLLGQFNDALSGFIRGQALVCLSLGAYYGIALTLAGVNFGLAIGVVSGVLSFIPYVGSIFGLVAGVGVAIFQFQNVMMPSIVLGIFIFGQLVEGNYLTPKLVGNRIGLHAVWVLLALMVGGSMFGFVGVMIAVPVAAMVGVLVRFALSIYRESDLYKGAGK